MEWKEAGRADGFSNWLVYWASEGNQTVVEVTIPDTLGMSIGNILFSSKSEMLNS